VNRPTESPPSLPLATLLQHCAGMVQAVRSGVSLNEALLGCPSAARAGTQALSFQVLRGLGGALAVRSRLAPRTPPAAADALLLSAIALLWPAESPPYAEHTLVDQAVAAARRLAPRSAGFINAVLRRFLRERETLCPAVQADPMARFNHPAWWTERLRNDWPDQADAILRSNNEHPPMVLRVNARRGTAAAYLERLTAAGISAHAGPGPHAVTLAQPRPVTRLPGFAEGDVSVQDAAAQLAAPLLLGAGLPPQARVLDACAAPGGKTAHLLELAELDVTALDRDAGRLIRVNETLQRLGLRANVRCADAGAPSTWWDGVAFDAILLDAPCSASGIVRRHPDIRWLRRATDINTLAGTQARLLEALWPLLRPGGRLLYCTCSVFKAEGSFQIDAFLQRNPNARHSRSPVAPGQLLPLPDNDTTPAAPAQRSPGDGFHYALIEKLPA
jgi:16S rRNA (cytosine967-C5)-methyltransferase